MTYFLVFGVLAVVISVSAVVPIKSPVNTRFVAKIFLAKNINCSLIILYCILVSGGPHRVNE